MLRSSSVVRDHVDHLALLDDVAPVCHRCAGEAEILLDQDDGEAPRLQLRDGAADLVDNDRREALPSASSSSRRLALVRRMRPIASICCSPPESLCPGS